MLKLKFYKRKFKGEKVHIQVTFEVTVSFYSYVNSYFFFTTIYKNITRHFE